MLLEGHTARAPCKGCKHCCTTPHTTEPNSSIILATGKSRTQPKYQQCFQHKLDKWLSALPDEPPIPGYPGYHHTTSLKSSRGQAMGKDLGSVKAHLRCASNRQNQSNQSNTTPLNRLVLSGCDQVYLHGISHFYIESVLM